MNKLKKILFILCISVIIIGISINDASANDDENNFINNIEITVNVNKNGVANITETWDVEVYDTNEMYRTYFNLNTSKIENLTVKDEKNIKYEFIDDWDIDADGDQKAGKCGIYFNEKYGETDICWGIQTNGKHVYTINYDITNFIKQKMGYQTINFKFLSSGINPLPKKASIIIQTESKFNEKNTDVEGVGFEGETKIENNKIIFNASNGLKKQDYMEVNIDFNDDSILTKSEEISQDVYKQGGILEEKKSNKYKILSTIIVIIIFIVGLPIYFIKIGKNIDKKNKK